MDTKEFKEALLKVKRHTNFLVYYLVCVNILCKHLRNNSVSNKKQLASTSRSLLNWKRKRRGM